MTDCTRAAKSRGWCNTHYERWRKHGSLETTRAANGEGYINASGYRAFERDGVVYLEHRQVMEHVLGRPLEKNEHVHHINAIRDDNRPANLKLVTHSTHRLEHVKYFRNSTHKECALCRQILPRAEFYPRQRERATHDPHSFYCRTCGPKQTRNYQPMK